MRLLSARPAIQGPPRPPGGWLDLVTAASADPIAAAVLALHHPEPHSVREDGSVTWWECAGDGFSGWEAEPPEWPCETVLLIADRHDIAMRVGA